ncbi:universal stress protein [Natronoglomus mannanivorans]|uniref:Universal stress protein n=1 Tax=Natronoglomus mannanivorans TaxID=2979990 RepID=A0AAP2YWG8_9EURY|nr:universal stress protein [Halobacteria archaeon AArc-xg1-1]
MTAHDREHEPEPEPEIETDPETTETGTENESERSGDTDSGPILVPNRILETDAIEPGVVSLLSRASVVLLGYHELPEQTPPGQARLQFEDRAQNRLDELAESLELAGATVETRLVFTHDREQTLNRVADETNCVATLLPNPSMRLEDVLVPLRGERSVERVAGLVGNLLAGLDVSVTLYHLERGDERASAAVLERGRKVLTGRGVDPELIETRTETSRTPVRAIVRTAEEFDAVVMGESDPGVMTFVFGQTAAEVAERFRGPVLVVRRRGDEDGPADDPTVPVERSEDSTE